MAERLLGLVAAAHTPFDRRGGLALEPVTAQAALLARLGVRTVFVGGSTGESASLALDERLALAGRWAAAAPAAGLRLVVHVGANCLSDSQAMAAHAASVGAGAIAALSPSYFKPASLAGLIDCCAEVAGAAPALPFYFYDIPALTGVSLPMPAFLEAAGGRIPNLAGLKFTNPDMMAYQQCLHLEDGRFDIPWGIDECLLAATALGARGAVGSSYNFAAPIYLRMLAAFAAGDLPAARREQYRSVELIRLLATFGYMGAAKAVMGFLGVEVGQPRLPMAPLPADRFAALRTELERLGFFGWLEEEGRPAAAGEEREP